MHINILIKRQDYKTKFYNTRKPYASYKRHDFNIRLKKDWILKDGKINYANIYKEICKNFKFVI